MNKDYKLGYFFFFVFIQNVGKSLIKMALCGLPLSVSIYSWLIKRVQEVKRN